jgi:predicted RNA-binding Zn ribbon-like protein
MTKNLDLRFGGCELRGIFHFQLTGGAVALDFANTLDERGGVPVELLSNYGRLLNWSEQVGVLRAREARLLRARARVHPARAEETLNAARNLRESVFEVASSLAQRRTVPPAALAQLNRFAGHLQRNTRLVPVRGALEWRPGLKAGDLSSVFWQVVRSATEIMTNPEQVMRLRVCAGAGCQWLFLDFSRRHDRRWCDMSVCGNRAKVTRYRARKPARHCS